MNQFTVGDRVRIDIPNQTDIDYELHGRQGEVIDLIEDEAASMTGDERDSILYRVQIDDGKEMDFRLRDLRPAFD